MQTLHTRRIIASVMFLYKLLNGLIDCGSLLREIKLCVPRLANHRVQVFYLDKYRTNYGSRCPINIMCFNFNSIAHLVDINADNIKKIWRCVAEGIPGIYQVSVHNNLCIIVVFVILVLILQVIFIFPVIGCKPVGNKYYYYLFFMYTS